MHYYKRNLGDYAKKCGRLSMLQHGSYTLLIDACYDREQFPTMSEAIDWTWASSKEEIEAVEFVLRRFFTEENGVYVQNRIKSEIAEFHSKATTNQRIAIERETKRKELSTKRAPVVQQSSTINEQVVNEAPPNQEPLTTNQEPIDTPIPPVGASQPSVSVKRQSAVSITTWLESIKAIGEKPIPADDSVFEYADKVGIPPEFLRLYWREFRERYSQKGSKRYTDWRKVFRNSVRGNWLKLWWVDSCGTYALTTTGKQAEMAAA